MLHETSRLVCIRVIVGLFTFIFLPLVLALDESIKLTYADKVQSLGFQGEGQTVCVIDSGINYTHPAR